MSQQPTNHDTSSSSGWILNIYNAFQNWISREIIDFDPCDNEAIVVQQVLEQFRQTQTITP